MYRDEIISEVWRIRDAYVEAHHRDLDAMVEDLRLRQSAHPEKLVDRRRKGPKSPRQEDRR